MSKSAATVGRASVITEHQPSQLERANASGRTPVVFVHGLCLLPRIRRGWAGMVGDAGCPTPSPALHNPANRHRAVPLTYEQFRYAFANAVSEDEAKELSEAFAVPAPAEPQFQAAAANLNPWSEVKVKTKNPDRGPLLIMDGEKDHTVPWAIANASYKRQRRNDGVTEIVKVPNRGHALTIDSGWREVADIALAFVKRYT